MKILFPIVIFLSIAYRGLSTLLYLIFSILGIILIFSREKNKADITWFVFILSQLFFNFVGDFIPTNIYAVYLEGKYLLIYPCGIFIRFICKKYSIQENFNFYKILLIGLGFYLLIFKGFTFRFAGGESLPILGDVFPPTFSLAIMYVILQTNFKIKKLSNILLLLFFFQSSVVSNSLAILFVFLKNNLVKNINFLFLKFKLKKKIIYIFPVLFLLLFYLYTIIKKRGDGTLYFEGLNILQVDRIAFYFSYFLTFLDPITDINNFYNLFTGWGIGTSVFSWLNNLPIIFFEAITKQAEGIIDASLIFQVEFLRVLYSHGVFGIVFIIFLIKEIFVSEENFNNKKLNDYNNSSILNPDLVSAILIISLLTITFSTSSNFLTFAFTVFANPYNIRSDSKAIKNHY